MSVETAIGAIVTIVLMLVAGFIHHLYQCRRIHEKLGRIMEHLGMGE